MGNSITLGLSIYQETMGLNVFLLLSLMFWCYQGATRTHSQWFLGVEADIFGACGFVRVRVCHAVSALW